MDTCPLCNATKLQPSDVMRRFTFKAGSITVTGRGTKCPKCSETFIPGNELEEMERQVVITLGEQGATGGDVFRFLRKAAGFPAKTAAKLVGTTQETVSRWENGKRDVPPAEMALMNVLAYDTIHGGCLAAKHLERMTARKPEIFEIKVSRKQRRRREDQVVVIAARIKASGRTAPKRQPPAPSPSEGPTRKASHKGVICPD